MRLQNSAISSKTSSLGSGRTTSSDSRNDFLTRAPDISLPKGGGAIRGVDEKFQVNPANGSASMTIPIATSPGRAGFGPRLALSYSSGGGNGVFGLGWTLSLPQITRKTDKGLPRYQDETESDTFILSGSEDLVPLLDEDKGWIPMTESWDGHVVYFYKPRIEGLFARIERWVNVETGETKWRSISRDNIITWYGKTSNSQIKNPENELQVFSWLICESYDDKGNALTYEYEPENSQNISNDVYENSRTEESRSANRYIKRIKYGNQTPYHRDSELPKYDKGWLFEVIFDYGDEHYLEPERPPAPNEHLYIQASLNSQNSKTWPSRPDPFSSYRAGFELRTYRLCQRVLMVHHFKNELGIQNYLVKSTSFKYQNSEIASFITAVTHSSYKYDARQNKYLKKSLPPVELTYSQVPSIDELNRAEIKTLADETSRENLPVGLDGQQYRWVDIDGEGLSGILTQQGNVLYYKANLGNGRFGQMQQLPVQPAHLNLSRGQQLLDLAGDGQLDLVAFAGNVPGFYERSTDFDWESFKSFKSLPNIDWGDPNLRFIDLTGDGRSDILITENDVFSWYESLAEDGFSPAQATSKVYDEESGPRLVFSDGTQSIYLADFSGDGLVDFARIRNGEVCYWPNLGYGRFGKKVTMDNAPWFDRLDAFSHSQIRLADIDGSGIADILYLKHDQVDIYFNKSGNSWSERQSLFNFPLVDNQTNVEVIDLLGNGTACLVWSTPSRSKSSVAIRYLDLMNGRKPHLLIKTENNLGAETKIHYASSTKFYIADKLAGTPWITRIPFPVQVIEKVETIDKISRNRFVTRYAYHHGYYDGVEREFRGFGMVEQWDTEEFAALSDSQTVPNSTNIDPKSHVPPVKTKTWFHTGAYLDRDRISNFFAGIGEGEGEYYRHPDYRSDAYDAQVDATLLKDTVLPSDLTFEEEREACRALKGVMLRQEIYSEDGSNQAEHPYTVAEQNFTIKLLQAKHFNRHAIFFTHPREALSYHYERNPDDPRVTHALTLQVDKFGNVEKEAAIAYGRKVGNSPLSGNDLKKQERINVTFTENEFTNSIEQINDYRTPLPCETKSYEITGYDSPIFPERFTFEFFKDENYFDPITEIDYAENAATDQVQKRLIEHVQMRYRSNDLTTLLDKRVLQSQAHQGETYKKAFTPKLLNQTFIRERKQLLTTAVKRKLKNGGDKNGGYVDLDADGCLWIPSGRVYLSPNSEDSFAEELAFAENAFFLPHRYRDPFYTAQNQSESVIIYDRYFLLVQENRDALHNKITVGERLPNGDLNPNTPGYDYRLLQPWRLMDPNRNRTQVAFDTLGMVIATATMGKPEDNMGDSLINLIPDLTDTEIQAHLTNPFGNPNTLLQNASSRLLYDLFAYVRTKGNEHPSPPVVYTMARETHASSSQTSQQIKIQHSFSYSDGFGREVQAKIQAEPGSITLGGIDVARRWVGSGWTIFNNKGKPVRQFEPFFSETHRFEFGIQVGVSPIIFYDPLERIVATLHPNHTYEKVLFTAWEQKTFDVNDTVLLAPHIDEDVKRFFVSPDGSARIPQEEYLPTWYALRTNPDFALEAAQTWPNPKDLAAEKQAAQKTRIHANTPSTAHTDSLGRVILTVVENRYQYSNEPDVEGDLSRTRASFDIEGNQREVWDERTVNKGTDEEKLEQRMVMKYGFDMLGNRIFQASIEAGSRWMLMDAAGNPFFAWDSRNHTFSTEYDLLRRPLRTFVKGANSNRPNQTLLTERLIYGEQHPESEQFNLRGTLFQHFDQAGLLTNEAYDFKGNLLRLSRQLAKVYQQSIDWQRIDTLLARVPGNKTILTVVEPALRNLLEDEIFTTQSTFDALNRPLTETTPHAPSLLPTVIRYGYNEANLLESIEANLHGQNNNGQPVWESFVNKIDYDAKGQRLQIDYGNGTSTTYAYDSLTFRLTHMLTQRNSTIYANDCPQQAASDWPGCHLQSLHYAYDPVGNITAIRDEAQQTIFFRNKRVEPSSDYTYDARYRLIEATGREHLGQVGGKPIPYSHSDSKRIGLDWSKNDGRAMGRYLERYHYDEVGNFLEMAHFGSDHNVASWAQKYSYLEASQLEGDKKSNRLSYTALDKKKVSDRNKLAYDDHGNMTKMPHLQLMQWDYQDQLKATAKQRRPGSGSPETTWYVYDASGQRVRKVTNRALSNESAASGRKPTRKSERIYVGSFEIYREYRGNGKTIILEKETINILDNSKKVLIIEAKSIENSKITIIPSSFHRFLFANHLRSINFELDIQSKIISYEEYSPYGSTTYQATKKKNEIAFQYRFSGKERDEESGLYYFGARYYSSEIGRWTGCDPVEGNVNSAMSLNRFLFTLGNPIVFTDPDGRAVNLAAAGIGGVIGGLGGAIVGAWTAKPGERWSAALKGGVVGAGAGALAGLTFGASLAATGAVGIGGTAVATGGTTGSILISGTLAGAVGGGAGGTLDALSNGAPLKEALDKGVIGAFAGSVGGAVGGASGVVTSKLTGNLTPVLSRTLEGAAGGLGGDAAVQGVLISAGVKESFSASELLFSTAMGGLSTASLSKTQQTRQNNQNHKSQRREIIREKLANFREEAAAELAARDKYLEIRLKGSNTQKRKTKVTAGMANQVSRKVTAERNNQKHLGAATDTEPIVRNKDGSLRPCETCAENALAVNANASGNPIGNGENVTFFAIEANPSMLPKNACLNCQAQFPKANFASGIE